jgi:hypothetical protein
MRSDSPNQKEIIPVVADKDVQETWEANGRIVIHKTNASGQIMPTMVNRGKRFTITAVEREAYGDRAASEKQDPFKNGLLSPVRLIEGSEAERFYADHPNTMTEEDMQKLFKGHWKTFEKRIGEVSSPFILNRMLEMAKSDENATVKQQQTIEARLEEIEPRGYTEVSSDAGPRSNRTTFTPAV